MLRGKLARLNGKSINQELLKCDVCPKLKLEIKTSKENIEEVKKNGIILKFEDENRIASTNKTSELEKIIGNL